MLRLPCIRLLLTATSLALLAPVTAQTPPARGGKKAGKGAIANKMKAQPLERFNVPTGVKLVPDVAYREGNAMWRVDLALPDARWLGPRPAIVFIHGGGWRAGDKRAGYFLQGALDYAAKGYVGLSINYRLVDDAPFPAAVEDVRCAVRWLRANAGEYNVDPNRIGGYGNSAGAHLVAHLALAGPDPKLDGDAPWKEHSSLLQAVCASATPADFTGNIGGNAARWQERGSFLYGPAETLDERLRLASPVSFARADAPPMLLIHGDADTTVRPEQSFKLYAALKSAGAKDVTLMIIHDVGHGVFQQHSTITQPAMEAFFGRTLKP
jgi:acetyl esterase/lipase